MRLTQIRQILEIEKCTSISQAARNLYVSQPGLSALLNEFETEIGVQIFTRSKSGIVPTEDGARILEAMKQIMQEVNYIETYAAQAEALSGDFTLMIGSSYEFLCAELIQKFKHNFPKANLRLVNMYSANVPDRVSKGLIDAAIMAIYDENGVQMAPPFYKNLTIEPLKNCHTFAVMNPAHNMTMQQELVLSQLVSEQLILGRQYEVDTYTESLPLEKYPISELDRLTVLQLLDQNCAVYLDASPLTLEQYKTNYPGYQVIPVKNDYPHLAGIDLDWPVHLIYRDHQVNRLQQLFLHEIRTILQQYNLFLQPATV